MQTKRNLIRICLLAIVLMAPSAQAQFQWAKRIASSSSLPEREPDIGLTLDSQDNCYVTGWFDGTNNFGGVTLTSQSTGGSDIFVAKYNSTGALQWVQRAGGTSINYGRGIGMDTDGNVYVTGGYQGPASFDSINMPPSSGERFFLAKYNNAGAIQWVQPSIGGSGVYGTGLAADGAGNSYALAFANNGATYTFGSVSVSTPNNADESTILVKYDHSGTAQWAQLMGGAGQVYATKVAVDAAGNVYVRGTFVSTLTIGSSVLVVSAGSTKNMFIAKFSNSGALTWVQHPIGGDVDEGGVAVDPAGNVYVSGSFNSNLDFGSGVTLVSMADNNAPFGDAFVARYNSLGAIQWAQAAGGTAGGFYWDVALDAQTNIYAGGFLGSDATVAKYNPAGAPQSTQSASGTPATPIASLVAKCEVDSAGNSYLAGWYQGTASFGTNTLQPQGSWNFFLAKMASPVPSNPLLSWTNPASIIYGATLTTNQLNAVANVPGTFAYTPTNGAVLPAGTNMLSVVFSPSDTVGYSNVTGAVSLVVLPAPLTITANNRSKTYGQLVSFGGTEFTSVGLQNSETVGSVTLTSSGATTNAEVGTYPIIPNAATGGTFDAADYSISYVNGTLTVTAAAPNSFTISAPSLSSQVFSVSVRSQLGSNYTLQFKNSLTDPSWTDVQTVTGADGPITLTDTAANTPTRIYRVRAN